MSPYLHFGHISALEVALAVRDYAQEHKLIAAEFLDHAHELRAERAAALAHVAERRFGQSLGPTEDGGERVVQLVGDAGDELAERGQLLALRQPLAQLLAFRLESRLRRQVARDEAVLALLRIGPPAPTAEQLQFGDGNYIPVVYFTYWGLRAMAYTGSFVLLFTGIGISLAIVAIGIAIPIFVTYVQEGLVPRLPTAILSTGLMLLASLSATVSNAEEFGDWLDSVRDGVTVIVDEAAASLLKHADYYRYAWDCRLDWERV